MSGIAKVFGILVLFLAVFSHDPQVTAFGGLIVACTWLYFTKRALR